MSATSPRQHVAVIFVARDCWDVETSERSVTYGRGSGLPRSTWTCHEGPNELRKYESLTQFFEPTDPICIAKQRVWQRLQKRAIKSIPGWHAFTVDYNSLATFAPGGMWRSAAQRKDFMNHQIVRR